MIRIDGSYGEGGGQILRTALSLSAILNKPFEVYNIRKGRKKPGLLAQHLTGVNAAQVITDAKVSGNNFGSLSLIFEPKAIKGGEYEFNVAEERGSAGAATLVAQTILPILFFADKESKVTLKGGTHVPFSPPFDYLKEVLLPTLANLGFNAKAELKRYGFYPVGGGEILLTVKPSEQIVFSTSSPLMVESTLHRGDPIRGEDKGEGEIRIRETHLSERGALKELRITSKVANLPLSIAERQKNRLLELLKSNIQYPTSKIECEVVKAPCPGTYLFMTAGFENIRAGFSALGAKGKPAEKIADEVFEEFSHYFNQKEVFDPHLADQILIFLALSKRPFNFTTTKITDHLLTNIWVINQFLPEFKIEVQGNSVNLKSGQ
jgi:RNA 3'-terminal phosphate cyclase (ATP)